VTPVPAAVTAWGLPSAHRFPTRPLPDDEFTELLGWCELGRVVGLLGLAIGDRVPATDGQRDQADEIWDAWLGHAVRVERLALEVLAALGAMDIRALALKGVALAHVSYPDPSARVFGDVDLLVEPGRMHAAGETLVAVLDGTRAEPELRPGYDDRFGREVLVRVREIEVDLHRTFVNGAFGTWADLDACFRDATAVEIGGQPVPILGPTDRLLHAAYAATLSDWPPKLAAYRDLAQVVVHDPVDLDAVLARAADARAEAVLAAGVVGTWRALRLTTRLPLLEWAQRYRPSRRDRALMAAAHGPARGYTSQLTSFVAIPGIRARVAFARAVLWPSREYRTARGLGPLGLIGSGATRARRA
jgi:hypothetical protein